MKTLLRLALPLFVLAVGCSSPSEDAASSESALNATATSRETPREFEVDTLGEPRAIIELIVPNVVDCGLKLTFPSRPSAERVALLGALLHTAVYVGSVHPAVHTYDAATGELMLTFPGARAWSGDLVIEAGDLRTPLGEHFRRILMVPTGAPVGSGTIVRC